MLNAGSRAELAEKHHSEVCIPTNIHIDRT
jgi:hypothetical protein